MADTVACDAGLQRTRSPLASLVIGAGGIVFGDIGASSLGTMITVLQLGGGAIDANRWTDIDPIGLLRQTGHSPSRFSAAFVWQRACCPTGEPLMDRAQTSARISDLMTPFNKKGIAITDAVTFAGDLEWDSLTVMDFVAAIEDEFDIIISMNQQAEIETYGQLVDAVIRLRG